MSNMRSVRCAKWAARLPVVLALLGLLATAPGASAAALPGISTGPAQDVGYGGATLTGAIDPRGSDTSYYFQYGPTKAYGSQTALANAGGGNASVPVQVPVSGLQPLTTYHYRLIAVNADGASTGADRSFRTAAIPLSLQILVAPNPVVFGGPITIEGTLLGSLNAYREVVLQADAFPYTAGFADVGNPEVTSTTGGFSFPVIGLTLATQYRVVTLTTRGREPDRTGGSRGAGRGPHRPGPRAPSCTHLRHGHAGDHRHAGRDHAGQPRPQRARGGHGTASGERIQLPLLARGAC